MFILLEMIIVYEAGTPHYAHRMEGCTLCTQTGVIPRNLFISSQTEKYK